MKARLNEALCRMLGMLVVFPVLIIFAIFAPKKTRTHRSRL